MKRIILSILLSLQLFTLKAQLPSTCDYALSLCPKRSASHQLTEGDCKNGTSRLFFQFESVMTASTGGGFLVYTVSGNASSSYKVYGPFDDADNSCDMINSYSAPVLEQNVGNGGGSTAFAFPLVSGKKYVIELLVNSCSALVSMSDLSTEVRPIVKCQDNINTCEDCLPKFLPDNDTYVLSAWVKDASAPVNTTSYSNPQIIVSTNTTTYPAFTATGQIIDGWQRIEGTFQTSNIQAIGIELKSLGGTCYFDDVRVFPSKGSVMSYVYDPISLRLLAELDERNYAKFYEYDEEGKLIRIKKETEKGIMTIQENRDNSAGN